MADLRAMICQPVTDMSPSSLGTAPGVAEAAVVRLGLHDVVHGLLRHPAHPLGAGQAVGLGDGHRGDALLVEGLPPEGAVGLLVVAQPVEGAGDGVAVTALGVGVAGALEGEEREAGHAHVVVGAAVPVQAAPVAVPLLGLGEPDEAGIDRALGRRSLDPPPPPMNRPPDRLPRPE